MVVCWELARIMTGIGSNYPASFWKWAVVRRGIDSISISIEESITAQSILNAVKTVRRNIYIRVIIRNIENRQLGIHDTYLHSSSTDAFSKDL
jgi:hypothetical protein